MLNWQTDRRTERQTENNDFIGPFVGRGSPWVTRLPNMFHIIWCTKKSSAKFNDKNKRILSTTCSKCPTPSRHLTCSIRVINPSNKKNFQVKNKISRILRKIRQTLYWQGHNKNSFWGRSLIKWINISYFFFLLDWLKQNRIIRLAETYWDKLWW